MIGGLAGGLTDRASLTGRQRHWQTASACFAPVAVAKPVDPPFPPVLRTQRSRSNISDQRESSPVGWRVLDIPKTDEKVEDERVLKHYYSKDRDSRSHLQIAQNTYVFVRHVRVGRHVGRAAVLAPCLHVKQTYAKVENEWVPKHYYE